MNIYIYVYSDCVRPVTDWWSVQGVDSWLSFPLTLCISVYDMQRIRSVFCYWLVWSWSSRLKTLYLVSLQLSGHWAFSPLFRPLSFFSHFFKPLSSSRCAGALICTPAATHSSLLVHPARCYGCSRLMPGPHRAPLCSPSFFSFFFFLAKIVPCFFLLFFYILLSKLSSFTPWLCPTPSFLPSSSVSPSCLFHPSIRDIAIWPGATQACPALSLV